MEAQVIKSENNGKFIYSFNGKVFRNSKRDYRFGLMFKSVKSMGGSVDGDFYLVALGNNANNLVSSWKHIYHYGELKVVEIANN